MEHECEECLPVVSLFSGSGGLDTGFIEPVSLQFWRWMETRLLYTFHTNYPAVPVIKKDLSEVSPEFLVERVLELPGAPRPVGAIGGPPCQAFSRSNGHKTAQPSAGDHKNAL